MNGEPTARDLMTSPVHRLSLQALVPDAAAFLLRHKISGAPVVDDVGHGRGVFTMSDIARAVAAGPREPQTERSLESREPPVPQVPPAGLEELGSLRVADLMTPGIVTIRPDASLRQVLQSLCGTGVHRLFVLEKEGHGLEGVITIRDLAGCLEASGKRT